MSARGEDGGVYKRMAYQHIEVACQHAQASEAALDHAAGPPAFAQREIRAQRIEAHP